MNKNTKNVITVDGMEEAFKNEKCDFVSASFADFEFCYFGEVLPRRHVSAEEQEKRNLELVSRIQNAAKNGEEDNEAVEALMTENRGMIYKRFLRWQGAYKATEAHYLLLSECVTGLIDAAKRYDSSIVKSTKTDAKSTKFSTYAYSVIECIMKEKCCASFKAKNERMTVCSIDDKVRSESDETLADIISDENSLKPFSKVENEETFRACFSVLNPIERQAVTWYYFEGLRECEIGRRLNCNGLGVKEILQGAVKKMQAFVTLPPVA